MSIDNEKIEYFYYIENCGCDDVTLGLIKCSRLKSDPIFLANFMLEIDMLNKNSSYGCQPTIKIYRIPGLYVREATPDDPKDEVIHTTDGALVLTEPIEYFDNNTYEYVLKDNVIRIL